MPAQNRSEDNNSARTGHIRVGIGGWTFEPWRGTFYPEKLPKTRELEYAASKLTAIEINGTFYRGQSAKSFAKWHDETPDDFVFALKGHRAIAMKKKLAETGDSLDWFINGGIAELKQKLGPILWQFAPSRVFDAEDIAAFLKLLPQEVDGLPLRHALEVRHESFLCEEFVDLASRHNAAIVYAESDDYPGLAEPTADFAYVRLMRTREEERTGYSPSDLDAWAERARVFAHGDVPDDLQRLKGKGSICSTDPHAVFIFFIAGAKVRNPHAAMELMARLDR
ncbi:uncharacterized protein YecE (DUF72 family) [Rhodopseudomonas julia]|uniref:Uncharacterized protein YecE (DUF72 family) n=1 Tax=Rhodopseudomonas julia TaxID=200617 RepID=A0ABU0CAB2_9BRAD|nr:DUF72 domain-containing protein [Rhodopseudomonas julia]MDQ0327475.1 uncharacterized protein YecE (DUF72 family) [Rhodopseudomonas julia]